MNEQQKFLQSPQEIHTGPIKKNMCQITTRPGSVEVVKRVWLTYSDQHYININVEKLLNVILISKKKSL